MVFDSGIFLLAFLPGALLGFHMLAGRARRLGLVWLLGASLLFYGWWNPRYVPLIVGSVLFNYTLAALLHRRAAPSSRKTLLVLGVGGNLALLGYFKYAGFFASSVNAVAGTTFSLGNIVLPLAISFFTFTEIAYLVDVYRGNVPRYSLTDFALFVTFFPHLIAGPIVHHWQVLPALKSARDLFNRVDFSIGLAVLVLGLFEKIVLADAMAGHVDPVFQAAEAGQRMQFFTAWKGAIGYAMRLYFDFSGYSDMAIGIALMFGVKFPMNFNTPYRAASMIDFWRRWHITLSGFLQEYLYFTLGGNRKGTLRRYVNLMVTMLLGGLWHGAGWTFVAWGGVHGCYLVINHAWRRLLHTTGHDPGRHFSGRIAGTVVTFVAVTAAWVLFRATTWQSAVEILRGMFGLNGLPAPRIIQHSLGPWIPLKLVDVDVALEAGWATFLLDWLPWIVALALAFFGPSTQRVIDRLQLAWASDAGPTRLGTVVLVAGGLVSGVLLFLVIKGFFEPPRSPFIYFNF